MKKTAIVLIIVLLCSIFAGCDSGRLVIPEFLGLPNTLKIQSDSMAPTFKAGDTIVYEPVQDPGDLRTGDIIVFWTVISGERVLCAHRIHEIYDDGGGLVFATKGDNNNTVDALSVYGSDIVGKYLYTLG